MKYTFTSRLVVFDKVDQTVSNDRCRSDHRMAGSSPALTLSLVNKHAGRWKASARCRRRASHASAVSMIISDHCETPLSGSSTSEYRRWPPQTRLSKARRYSQLSDEFDGELPGQSKGKREKQ